MHDKHDNAQIFENLQIRNPNATTLRLPKHDTLVVEAGETVITIDGQGNVHIASCNEISVTTGQTMSFSARLDAEPAASSLCDRTSLQYDAWKTPKPELTEPSFVFETSSTGDVEEIPSS